MELGRSDSLPVLAVSRPSCDGIPFVTHEEFPQPTKIANPLLMGQQNKELALFPLSSKLGTFCA